MDLVRQIRSRSPGDALFDAKVKVLGEYVDHHVKEEEGGMFPKARKARVDLADLACRMAERRIALESEHSMEPFDLISSGLMRPIRAAASAGTGRGRKAAGTGASASPGGEAGRGGSHRGRSEGRSRVQVGRTGGRLGRNRPQGGRERRAAQPDDPLTRVGPQPSRPRAAARRTASSRWRARSCRSAPETCSPTVRGLSPMRSPISRSVRP